MTILVMCNIAHANTYPLDFRRSSSGISPVRNSRYQGRDLNESRAVLAIRSVCRQRLGVSACANGRRSIADWVLCNIAQHQLSTPRHYAPAEMKAAAERDRKVRVDGNINLLAALRSAGVRRHLLQSSGFWYSPGVGLADESVPFISSASPGVETNAGTYRDLEARATATPGIEFAF
jgi:hypothetical protein